MASTAIKAGDHTRPIQRPKLDGSLHPAGRWVFAALLLGGLAFAGISILTDTAQVGEQLATGVFLFLGLALLIALGFEFVNGFHDAANAVATVIYTHAMPAPLAVIWSGAFNFLGVMLSSGAVAYSIVTLLPIDLVLHVGSAAGYAMIFALLLAAVIWNLGTWWVGLPNSSSHALIGSVLGVGLMNQIVAGHSGTSGVDWTQAEKVLAALLLLVLKRVARDPALYREPASDAPPPRGIRALLVFTCTAVSFAHGGNDGQKGMGLIMLILIGCAPTAYALNRTLPEGETAAFVASAAAAQAVLDRQAGAMPMDPSAARVILTSAARDRRLDGAKTFASMATISRDVTRRIQTYGSLREVPAAATPNLRNDMYLVLDASKLVSTDAGMQGRMSVADMDKIKAHATFLEQGTRYIPRWVKLTVALALGLGTMVGWKRIVATVGERIGQTHLTYGMGASAELVAASTILLAERFGLPVSTTHILSSGVAGAAVANRAGLQRRTVRNMVVAWILTLPAAMLIAGSLYWVLLHCLSAPDVV
jgi:PiT family inorganic phosphate transporter